MEVNSVSTLSRISGGTESLIGNKVKVDENRNETFESIFQSAMNLLNETNAYSNAAAEQEMAYAMGLTNNTHELQIAQTKASISLQYTMAIRNAVMDAYKEIMQLQF